MSDKAERELAHTFLQGINIDPLLGLKDIQNYSEPNFLGNDSGDLYLVRCYVCPDSEEHGRENYMPNVASGKCTWCGWAPDPQIISYINAVRILKKEID